MHAYLSDVSEEYVVKSEFFLQQIKINRDIYVYVYMKIMEKKMQVEYYIKEKCGLKKRVGCPNPNKSERA